ncbi:MAG: hypothetical protein HRT58_15360 [Crocinitomicaceae bacterium]|nr:hypothetical protein [Flavobacteriales bacterium]NQZ37046.1 hypothetical protein [Crocinitomicaceae bacterium]
MTYLRFVVGIDTESASRQDGLFTELIRLKNNNLLLEYQYEILDNTFKYFNDNLPVPPYKRKNLSKEAVAWFKDSATDYIKRMWDLVAILEQNDVNVRILKTEKPGMIIYVDEFQVVAKSKKY